MTAPAVARQPEAGCIVDRVGSRRRRDRSLSAGSRQCGHSGFQVVLFLRVDIRDAMRALSGTVGDMEKAFRVKLFDYEHPEGDYRGRVGDVYVPAALKDVVPGSSAWRPAGCASAS